MSQQAKDIPNKLVNHIANALDCDMICFMNPDTFEVEGVPNDALVGMYFDAGSQKALHRVDQWNRTITIDLPDTVEIMRTFVNSCILSDSVREKLRRILALRRPDKHFHTIIDDSGYRDRWAKYHRQQMIHHIRQRLNNGMVKEASLPRIETL